MRNKQIYVDYDGVLVDLPYKWLEWINHKYIRSYHIKDVDKWLWFDELDVNAFEYFRGSHAYSGGTFECKPFNGATSFLDTLSDQYNVSIVTATHSSDLIDEKDNHARKYFNIDRLTHSRSKFMYAVDNYGKPNVLVDDNLENCLMWIAYGGVAMLYTDSGAYNYNNIYVQMPNLFIVGDYTTILDTLRMLNE